MGIKNIFKNWFSVNNIEISEIDGESVVKVRKGTKSTKSTIYVNGKSYSGNNVTIINDVVYIDGKKVEEGDLKDGKNITISVDGNINNLQVDSCNSIDVEGNVNVLKSKSGDVIVRGDVDTNVLTTSGDIEINGNVGGNVNTMSGDVECRKITGSVTTMSGDINYE